MQSSSVGIIIPTFQAAKHLPYCLPPLLQSPLKPVILIIDSSSTDETVTIAREMGVQTLVIAQNEFNHGATREKGRQYLRTPIVVMMTQDAYAASPETLGHLVKPLFEKRASIAYARQLPHQDAGFFGAFARDFNYPPKSHMRCLADTSIYGVYTFFCSNSCAAYVNAALDEIGGFPSVLFGEDSVVVAKLLRRQHRIAYVAEAEVFHSHDYTLKQEFRRHFDMGLSRCSYRDLLEIQGSSVNQRGKTYVLTLLKKLWDKSPSKIPYALLQTLAKFCGYRLGEASLHAPLWWKKFLSSQKFYWKKEQKG
jgi:rhamnosyltransferase